MPPATVFEFVHSLFHGLQGFVDFRLVSNDRTTQHFASVEDVIYKWKEIEAKLARANKAGANVYFGVNPRTTEAGRDENVSECRTLWADMDYREREFVEKNFAPLKALGLEPNVIVDSGHGYHLYWLLRESVEPERATAVMDEIIRVLYSDPEVNHPSGMLRLPGTTNLKSDPVPCRIIRFGTERHYSLSDFDALETVADGETPPSLAGKRRRLKRKVTTPTHSIAGPGGENGTSNGHGFAAALARAVVPFWIEGRRHALALGVAGLLRRDEVPQSEALAAVRKIVEIAGDSEGRDREQAVETTYAQPPGEIAGVSVVREVLGDRAREFLRVYKEVVRSIPPAPLVRAAMPAFVLDECVEPGSLFDRYVSCASSRTDAPLQYHLASALTLGAAALGNSVWADYYDRRLFATLYTLLVGPSSRFRKSTSVNFARRVGKVAGVETYPHNATVEQLYARMAREECEWRDERVKGGYVKQVPTAWKGRPAGIIYHSEFTHFLDASSKNYMADARSLLMSLYDGYDEARETKSHGRYYVEDPAISLLCGVTPLAVKHFCSRLDVGSGFLSRFLVVMPPKDHVNRYGGTKITDSAFLIEELGRGFAAMARCAGRVVLDEGAESTLVSFEEYLGEKIREVEGTPRAALDSFFARLSAMALKIAMVFCAGRAQDGKMPSVSLKDMLYATNFCRWVARSLEFFFDEISPDDGNRELRWRNQVLEAARVLAKRDGGFVSHRRLLQFAHLDADQFARAVESLLEEGRLLKGPIGARGGRTYKLNEVEVEI